MLNTVPSLYFLWGLTLTSKINFNSFLSEVDHLERSSQIIPEISKHPIVIVISLDGFRYDFFKKADTPNLNALKANGVSVPYMKPQFVTKTFPNHQSIATGLHTEFHGVSDSSFYDPNYGRVLISTSEEFWNFSPLLLPLWTLNELAGDGRKSGMMMWPGSSYPYGPNKTLPSHYEAWNWSMTFETRVDILLRWIVDKENPINLAFLYYQQPDSQCHAFGPESYQVTEQIKVVDSLIGYLVKQLKSLGIFDNVNLIILSDHGMQEIKQENIINISSINIADQTLYKSYGNSPVLNIRPIEGNFDTVYDSFKKASQNNNFTVYKKENLPDRWHYGNNRRVMPIVLVADIGYVFDDFYNVIETNNFKSNLTANKDRLYGYHGFDNEEMSMRSFFLGHGPMFKKGFIGNPFNNVDLFPLVCKILMINATSNNGTLKNVEHFLKTQNDNVLKY